MESIVWPPTKLGSILASLEAEYGDVGGPSFETPFEMLLWEMVAYLADDARRTKAFRTLRDEVGLTPSAILSASPDHLLRICRMGGAIAPELRVRRMYESIDLVRAEFDGDLTAVLNLPAKEALKALRKFPMIGPPGAEKILLVFGVLPVLALDSNGMRVLIRLGFGEESKSYSTTYNSVRASVVDQLPADCRLLLRAHDLVHRHGQELCKAGTPKCPMCPLNGQCPFNLTHALIATSATGVD